MTCRNLELSCRAVLVPGRAVVTRSDGSGSPASIRQRRLRERQRRGEIVVPLVVGDARQRRQRTWSCRT